MPSFLNTSEYTTTKFHKRFDWLDLVGFYVVSILVGYLMLNPMYTYLLNI